MCMAKKKEEKKSGMSVARVQKCQVIFSKCSVRPGILKELIERHLIKTTLYRRNEYYYQVSFDLSGSLFSDKAVV